MKKIFKLALVVVAVVTLSSCEDFLSHDKYGEPSSDNFWRNETDIQRAVDGLYWWTEREAIVGRGPFHYYNASDDCVTGRSNAGTDRMKNFIYDDSRSNADIWYYMYQLIKKSNDIIANVPNAPVSDAVKKNALCEAYFYRAFAYLQMAPFYGDNGVNGGIPIMTEDLTIDEMDQPRPASVLENYAMIISDLEKAIANDIKVFGVDLEENNYGRPHKTAAQAMIVKTALYAAHFDNSYLAIADKYASEILASPNHALEDNYADIFTMKNNYGKEYIWSFIGNIVEGTFFPSAIFENTGWGRYNCWGYFTPTAELYESYEEGDIRRDATILKPYDTFKFIPEHEDDILTYTETASLSGMLFRKYLEPFTYVGCVGSVVNPNGDYPTTNLNVPYIRFAEIYLFKAEAQIRMNGAGAGDEWINVIRKRAGLNSITGAGIDELLAERRHEFAIEFPNYFTDQVRFGKAEAMAKNPLHGYFVNKPEDKPSTEVTLNGKTVYRAEIWGARTFNPEINHVWPIPNEYISSSKNLKQNVGF